MTSYKIVECSSEDAVHPSSNLRNADLYRIWQTNGYIKKAIVDLTFFKPTKISLIDIGNAGSAFVEILVGKEKTEVEDFSVLVPIHGLMSLHDSKNNSNRSRTKCFEKFTADLSDQLWERMRIVCTQPFSDKSAIGLSYVFVNSKNKQSSSPSSSLASIALPDKLSQTSNGNKDSSNNNNNNNNNNNSNEDADTDVDEDNIEPTEKAPQAIQRDNSALIKKLQTEMKKKGKQNDADLNELEEQAHNSPIKPQPKKHQIKEDSDEDDDNNHKNNKSNNHNNNNDKVKSGMLILTPKNKKGETAPSSAGKSDLKKDAKPVSGPLKGVVFIISGLGGEERTEIREKGIALGAVYKPSWDDECTHCICSFANTPKYNEVKAKGGIIVTPKWILECAAKSKKVKMTKRYLLDEDKPQLSSDTTADKKKKKKKKTTTSDPTKGYDSDSNDDDDGKPNDYDFNDSFIDNDVEGEGGGDDEDEDEDGDFVPRSYDQDEEADTSDEDLNELLKEGKAFLKKNGGLKKRPRDESDEDEHSKKHKSQSHHKHHNNNDENDKGKTFSKQHHIKQENNNNNNHKKEYKQESKPEKKSNKFNNENNNSDEEVPVKQIKQTKTEIKHKASSIVPADDSGSGTEGMADDEVKRQFKHLMQEGEGKREVEEGRKGKKREAPSDELGFEVVTPKSKKNTEKPSKVKKELPNDDSGSGTEGMADVDVGRSGVYRSDASDSDGTQPIDNADLMKVLGALQGEAKKGIADGTLHMDAETNWDDFVTKQWNKKVKEKESLGKAYPVHVLPDFLAPVRAFFSNVSRQHEANLRKYIVAYDGKIDEYLGDDTKYIFTEKKWDKNFDNALKVNPNLVFVKPDWIFMCHSKQNLVDFKPYIIKKI